MQKDIPNRVASQIRTHAQKFLLQVKKKVPFDDPLNYIRSKPASFFIDPQHEFADLLYEEDQALLEYSQEKERELGLSSGNTKSKKLSFEEGADDIQIGNAGIIEERKSEIEKPKTEKNINEIEPKMMAPIPIRVPTPISLQSLHINSILAQTMANLLDFKEKFLVGWLENQGNIEGNIVLLNSWQYLMSTINMMKRILEEICALNNQNLGMQSAFSVKKNDGNKK